MKQKAEQYLTQEEINEFRELVLETYGIQLTEEEALDQGTRLIMIMEELQKFEPIQLSEIDMVENTAKSNKIDTEK